MLLHRVPDSWHIAEALSEVAVQEDSRRGEEEARKRRLAVKGRQDLEQQIKGNARLRELARVRAMP